MRQVAISGPDLKAWRNASRALLGEGVAPEEILWADGEALFGGEVPAAVGPAFEVPKKFLELAGEAACHRDPAKWALLYRVLWRLTHGEKELLEVEVDDDIRQLTLMAKAVHRDVHKMHAFVRFRKVEDQGGEHYVAWHRERTLAMLAASDGPILKYREWYKQFYPKDPTATKAVA